MALFMLKMAGAGKRPRDHETLPFVMAEEKPTAVRLWVGSPAL
jgi:hypothetical protein